MTHRYVQRSLPALAYSAFVFFVGLTGYNIVRWSVDVPFWDEWEVLRNPQLPTGIHWQWLWAQHNEHRILLTKLEVAGLYFVNGWNLVVQQILNYVFYVAAVGVVGVFASRRAPHLPKWVWPAFLLFLLSPRLSGTLLWGFQSQWHFAWAFALGSAMLAFTRQPSPARSLLGGICAALAIASLAGGVVLAWIIAGMYVLFQLQRLASRPSDWRREGSYLFLYLAPVALTTGLWLDGFHTLAGGPPLTMPWTTAFWDYFLNLVSLGFGIDTESVLFGLVCLVFVMVPVVVLLPDNDHAGLIAMIIAVLGVLTTISMGRAAYPEGRLWMKAPRYAELSQLLVPLTVLSWSLVLRERERARRGALLFLWFFCFFAFRDNWGYEHYFKGDYDQRSRGLACAGSYYEGVGGPNCPELYPADMREMLDNARILNVSFYRHLHDH